MAHYPGFDLSGSVVLVTGASRGIGAGLARAFASAGAVVAVGYNTDRAGAEAVVAELLAAGSRARAYHLNVTDSAQVEVVCADVTADFGTINVLVNNSGAYPHSDAMTMDENEWDAVMGVNAKGTFLCSRAAARVMRNAGSGGRIINVSSIAALQPERAFSHYSASKGAVLSLTRSLALEWAEFGITVNAILPGLIDGGSLHKYVPERARAYESLAPAHRAGRPEDVAGAVLFLASPAARFITGQTLVIDGGALLAGYMELARNEPGAPSA